MRKGFLAVLALEFLTVANAAAQVQLAPPQAAQFQMPPAAGTEPLLPPRPLPATGGQFVDPPLLPPRPLPSNGGPILDQQPLPPPTPYVPSGGPIADVPYLPSSRHGDYLPEGRQLGWVTLDYVLWFVKPGPLPTPLVTTGSPNDTISGALGQPNTVVLLGGHNLDYGTFGGGRLDVGFWLPQCPIIGFEGNYLALQTRSVNYAAFSDVNGNPVIARPVINAQTGTETSYIDSFPGVASGGVIFNSTTEFDSWEINAMVNLLKTEHFNWDMIVGFRSLDLTEQIQIQDQLVPLVAGNFAFAGGPVDPPNSLGDFDQFRTSNHFYGAQLGSRVDWSTGRLDLSWTVKVALGVTQEVTTVDGASFLFGPGSAPSVATGGILAQSTNIGRAYHSVFTVVPETGFNLGYQITPWLRAQAGYTFLYWSNVVRPGDQIDRTVNPSQVPTDGSFGTLTGPARPVLIPHSTDFWAQGVNFGLEFRF